MKPPTILPMVLLLVALVACGGNDPTQDFSFTIEPTSTNQPRGENGVFGVYATRTGGFTGAIMLFLEDPPQGVSGSGMVNAGEEMGELLITVGSEAALGLVDVTVVAEASTHSAGTLSRRQTISLTILAATVPRLLLKRAADASLPALIYEEHVTPEEGEAWTLQLIATSGSLLLDDGSYEHRLSIDSYVDGQLSGRERWTDRGSYSEVEGELSFSSELIQNLAFTAYRVEGGIVLQHDLYLQTDVHKLVVLEYHP